MVRHLEAVFEDGVLRPIEPLSLPERQHVRVTIDDSAPVAAEEINHRYAEQAWLGAHAREYIGQWVAIEGGNLVSHGPNPVPVRDEALSRGVACPFVVRIPLDFGGPAAGWL